MDFLYKCVYTSRLSRILNHIVSMGKSEDKKDPAKTSGRNTIDLISMDNASLISSVCDANKKTILQILEKRINKAYDPAEIFLEFISVYAHVKDKDRERISKLHSNCLKFLIEEGEKLPPKAINIFYEFLEYSASNPKVLRYLNAQDLDHKLDYPPQCIHPKHALALEQNSKNIRAGSQVEQLTQDDMRALIIDNESKVALDIKVKNTICVCELAIIVPVLTKFAEIFMSDNANFIHHSICDLCDTITKLFYKAVHLDGPIAHQLMNKISLHKAKGALTDQDIGQVNANLLFESVGDINRRIKEEILLKQLENNK